MTVWIHSSSKAYHKVQDLDSMLADLRHWVKCSLYALNLRFFLKTIEIAQKLQPRTLAASLMRPFEFWLEKQIHSLDVVTQSLTLSAGWDLQSRSWFFCKTLQNSCECKDIRNLTWVLWVKFFSECSLDLLDAPELFIFYEDECSLLHVERRILFIHRIMHGVRVWLSFCSSKYANLDTFGWLAVRYTGEQ